MTSPRCRWRAIWVIAVCSIVPAEPYEVANRWNSVAIRRRGSSAPTWAATRPQTAKASALLLRSSTTLTETNATVDWHPDAASKHKVVVLEDVVTRMQAQKNRLSNELAKSQSTVEDLETKLRAIVAREREDATAQREEQRIQLVELKDKLEAAKDEKRKMEQRTKQKFDMAREKAIEQHEQLQAKVEKLQSRLSSAQSKLDNYRKESFQRESLLRQKLESEREARDKLQSTATALTEELENNKSEIDQQKKLINETISISEAAVAAADRRESTLKQELKEANDEVASLRANHAAKVCMEEDSATVEQLRMQIESMSKTFKSERQVERQKWGKEIEALQEALEIARSSSSEAGSPSTVQTGKGRPSILRRIGRKLRL